MIKGIFLTETESKEVGVFLSKLLAEEKRDKARGIEPNLNIPLLEKYKKELLGI